MIGIDEFLRSVTNYALEVTAVPALVCGTERFHVFRTHLGCLLSQAWMSHGRVACLPARRLYEVCCHIFRQLSLQQSCGWSSCERRTCESRVRSQGGAAACRGSSGTSRGDIARHPPLCSKS